MMSTDIPYLREDFRRRVQQKLVDRYDNNVDDEDPTLEGSDLNIPVGKKSPYTLHNFIWIVAAITVSYFSDFVSVILYDMRIRRSWFWIGVILLMLHASIALFLVLWLSFYKKVNSDHWETMYPKAVPLATASFIIGGICLSVALWPVWGILTPVILGSMLMGIVVVIAMFG